MARTMVRSGNYTLAIDTDGASSAYGSSTYQGTTSFESKFGIKCPADLVPFIVVPLRSSTNGKSASQMVGQPALVVDNNRKTSTYAIVGDAGPANGDWKEVSLRCAWNLGYSQNEANGRQGPNGNFTVYVDPEASVSYTRGMSTTQLNSLINQYGARSFGGTASTVNTNTAYASAESGMYTRKEDINWEYLNYYIITIGRNSPIPNYANLLKNKVSGVIIEAGYLFNSQHQKVYYRNPKLREQCTTASKANIPWGLYCDSKARSVTEAKEELYQLSFCIRKYPPVLGMWVHFSLVKSKSINDSIVTTYKNELIRLGLIQRIGIIATESELSTISWKETHYKDWVLWLNRHISNFTEIQQLLSPEFFTV